MAVHNQPSFEAVPGLVKMNAIFEVYDTAAWKYKECLKSGLLHTAAEHLQIMAKLDSWFAIQRLEV